MTSRYAAKYIIFRYADPVFAILIGTSAALIRLRREENEKRSGLPSASFIISTQQQARIDAEYEQSRAIYAKRAGTIFQSEKHPDEAHRMLDASEHDLLSLTDVNLGYKDIITLGWERVKWKIDYEWNNRGKELQRKDGKMV